MKMQRKKGVYDLVFYKTKASPETIVTGVDWKLIQEKLVSNYKEFINVKDYEHTSEPYFVVMTSKALSNVKEPEEYFYTKKK